MLVFEVVGADLDSTQGAGDLPLGVWHRIAIFIEMDLAALAASARRHEGRQLWAT
jgi:hypothetical protein